MEKTSPSVLNEHHNINALENIAATILYDLQNTGYSHITEKLSEYDFTLVSERLGNIRMRTNLKVDPDKDIAQKKRRVRVNDEAPRPSVYTHLGLDFHMDSPLDKRLAWYCIQQDDKFGALWILDSRNIMKRFSEEEKDLLSTIRLRYIHIEDGVEYQPWEHLLVREDNKEIIYFAKWQLIDQYSEEQLQVIKKFNEFLKIENETNKISVRLKPGESIYVDNKRMLHARGAISENSKRHIIRLALSKSSS